MAKKKGTKTKPKQAPEKETKPAKTPPIQVQLDDHETRIARLEAKLK